MPILLTKTSADGAREIVELHSTFYVVRTVNVNGDIDISQKRYSNVPTTKQKVMNTYIGLGYLTEDEVRNMHGETY